MRRPSLFERFVYAVPVIGWMIKDVVHGRPENKWYFLVALVSLWIIGIMTVGYAAFIIPVLALVLAAFVTLVAITRG